MRTPYETRVERERIMEEMVKVEARMSELEEQLEQVQARCLHLNKSTALNSNLEPFDLHSKPQPVVEICEDCGLLLE